MRRHRRAPVEPRGADRREGGRGRGRGVPVADAAGGGACRRRGRRGRGVEAGAELARYVEGWGRPSDLGVVATNGHGEPKSSSPPSLSGSATYRTRPRRDRVRRRRPSPPSGMTTASAPYLPDPVALRLTPHPRRTIDKGVSDRTVPQTATEPVRYRRLYRALRTAAAAKFLLSRPLPIRRSGAAMPPSAGAEIDRPRRRATRTDCVDLERPGWRFGSVRSEPAAIVWLGREPLGRVARGDGDDGPTAPSYTP